MERRSPLQLAFLYVLQCFFLTTMAAQARLAPALYIFGDSIIDSGNNNNLKVGAVVNFPPYGVDFPKKSATGRFTNGYTIADFFDMWLGLPLAHPYFTTGENLRSKITEGFNYASGAAGILPETGRYMGTNLNMEKQVNLFRQTRQSYLPLHFKSEAELQRYLSKSIFVVIIGNNDYLNNYLQPLLYNSSRLYSVEQFGELLTQRLGQDLKNLYYLGARKFVVSEIGQLGCLPAVRNKVKPKTACDMETNSMVSIFNKKLVVQLGTLSSTLKGSTFITAKVYDLAGNIMKHPSSYGIKELRTACCDIPLENGNGECERGTIPCQDRNSHFFWDMFHPTEAVYKIVARECFSGTGLCTPMNVLQLARKP